MSDAARLLANAVESFAAIGQVADDVDRAASMIEDCLRAGGKVMLCGNGGSAADAQHLAAEFLGRFLIERAPLPALALTTNSSAVTAIGNDYGYDLVFSRQLRGLARSGDVLLGISTSGNSANVVSAFEAAGELGLQSISLTGAAPSQMADLADLAIRAPSTQTPRIQEMHIAIGHAICEIVEQRIAANVT